MKRSPHKAAERHRSERAGWLRAAVLGANDGIVSTASLVVGVAAAQADPRQVLTFWAMGREAEEPRHRPRRSRAGSQPC